MINFAYAAGEQQVGQGGGIFLSFIPIFVMFVIFYFLLIRPQQKKQKERQMMLENLKEGDNIVTQGGIIGTITKIKEDVVTLQVADQVRIKVIRSNISSLREK